MHVQLPGTAFESTFVASPHLQPLEDVWKSFYLLKLLTLPITLNKCTVCWSPQYLSELIQPLSDVDSCTSSTTFCIHGWSSGAGYAALNHWRPCSCRRRSTCLEQSSSRSAPISDIFYFQNTPEVTSVQHILPFSLTVSLNIFCTEPLKPLVLHTLL